MHAKPYLVIALRGASASCYWYGNQDDACRIARRLVQDEGRAFVFHKTHPRRPGRLLYRTPAHS